MNLKFGSQAAVLVITTPNLRCPVADWGGLQSQGIQSFHALI